MMDESTDQSAPLPNQDVAMSCMKLLEDIQNLIKHLGKDANLSRKLYLELTKILFTNRNFENETRPGKSKDEQYFLHRFKDFRKRILVQMAASHIICNPAIPLVPLDVKIKEEIIESEPSPSRIKLEYIEENDQNVDKSKHLLDFEADALTENAALSNEDESTEELRLQSILPPVQDSPKYTCLLCGKSLTTPYSLEAHRFIKHKADANPHPNTIPYLPYRCPQCNKRYSRKFNLTRHQKIHSKNRPHERCPPYPGRDKPRKFYPCQYCEKTFGWRYNLTRHELSHSHKGGLQNQTFRLLANEDTGFNNNNNLALEDKTTMIFYEPTFQEHTIVPNNGSSENQNTEYISFCKSEVFEIKDEFNEHIAANETDQDMNDLGFHTNIDIDTNQEEENQLPPENEYKPQLCEEENADKVQIQSKSEEEDKEVIDYPCILCGRRFSRKFNLNRHELSHRRTRNFRSRLKFKGGTTLTANNQNFQNGETVRPEVPVDIVNEKVSWLKSSQQAKNTIELLLSDIHKTTSDGIKQQRNQMLDLELQSSENSGIKTMYPCLQCGYTSRRKFNLTRHELSAHKDKSTASSTIDNGSFIDIISSTSESVNEEEPVEKIEEPVTSFIIGF